MESKPYASPARRTDEGTHTMQLPLEILAEIASILPNDIWKFACVCRQWRRAAIFHPYCWNRIQLRHTRSFKIPVGMKALLGLWIERSGGMQLELFLEGPFYHHLLSAPLVGCIPRIRKLHLTDWPRYFETNLQTITFPCLEALSVSTTQGAGVTLSRLSTAFLDNPVQVEGENLVRSPRLRELALCGIFIDVASLPRLPALMTLKLTSCIFDMSISLLDLLDQVRHSLEALCLWKVERKRYMPPIPETDGVKVEYPRLKYLTLRCDHSSSVFPQDFISHIASPHLVKLTCDDFFLPLLRPYYFPNLSDLYVDFHQSSSHKIYGDVLKQFSIVSLTIYCDSRSHERGLNTLLWSTEQSLEFGKTLRRLRYFTTEGVPQTILDLVNEKRPVDPSVEGEAVFASQIIIPKRYFDEDYLPWNTELWWTRK